jgi:hypothetical protein
MRSSERSRSKALPPIFAEFAEEPGQCLVADGGAAGLARHRRVEERMPHKGRKREAGGCLHLRDAADGNGA